MKISEYGEFQKTFIEVLNNHFQPMLKEEWKNSISIYDIGVKKEGDKILEIIVWLRSSNISHHASELLAPNPPMMLFDPLARAKTSPGHPRLEDQTIITRLLKPIQHNNNNIDLLVELFQVFPSKDDAENELATLLACG